MIMESSIGVIALINFLDLLVVGAAGLIMTEEMEEHKYKLGKCETICGLRISQQ